MGRFNENSQMPRTLRMMAAPHPQPSAPQLLCKPESLIHCAQASRELLDAGRACEDPRHADPHLFLLS